MARFIRIWGLQSCAAMGAALLTLSNSYADDSKGYKIPSQSLGSALREFARQSNREILFSSDVVRDKTTSGVPGATSPDAALAQLLAGTGLVSSTSPLGQILISRADVKGVSAATDPPGAPSGAPNEHGPISEINAGPTQALRLDEVVVTAQKRQEHLQDVPVPVTAINAETLVSQNEFRLQDYYAQIPGFNVAPMGFQSTQLLSIRGINTGLAGNPSVGISIDDVPFGASTNSGGGVTVPDFDPGDLARVEVLRGPQGTLYGASSLGGLLKFVTVDPSTSSFGGRMEAGTSSVHNGADLGYNFRGAVNVPLDDTLAIRASAFTHRDAGYIDNPVLRIDGINQQYVRGGRLAALWRPSDEFSLKMSALYQDTTGGSNDVDKAINGYTGPPLGDLQQNYLPGVGGHSRQVQAYSATINAHLGGIELTAASGYNVNAYHDTWDYSFGAGSGVYNFFRVTGAPFVDNNRTGKLSQEIRLSSSVGAKLDWLVGAFYTHEDSRYSSEILAADPMTGQVQGIALAFSYPTTFAEYAGFANLTYHFTDRFDVQIGGRGSHIKQTYLENQSGPLAGADISEITASSTPFTYLLTPRLKISPDLMVYARLASGYRSGGTNGEALPDAAIPRQYQPDKTEDYEIGVKGDALDHVVAFDVSVFYINWKDVQLTLLAPATQQSYITNAGGAKSQGVEFSVQSKPARGLTLGAWLTWNDAVLTQGFPTGVSGGTDAVAGDRLPYSTRFSGNLSVDDEFSLVGALTGFIGGDVDYVGDRKGEFTTAPPPPRQSYPAYAQINLHGGIRYETWTGNVFINNLTDKRGILGGGLGSYPPYAFSYIQPRTVGLSIAKTW